MPAMRASGEGGWQVRHSGAKLAGFGAVLTVSVVTKAHGSGKVQHYRSVNQEDLSDIDGPWQKPDAVASQSRCIPNLGLTPCR